MEKKKVLIFSIAATMILTSVLLSPIGGNMLQVQNGAMQGALNSPTEQKAPVALELFKRYEGKFGYVTAGIGVRNTGRGTISLTTPRGTKLRDAWLYWIVLDYSKNPNPNNERIVLNGILVTGTLIGTGPSPCWAPDTGYTYRARVNSMLTLGEGRTGISYGLEIGGMSSKTINGKSPWTGGVWAPLAESVHLVLVYSDPTVAGSVLHIYDGYYEQGGGIATFAYAWPARAAGSARFSHLTADGQEIGVTPFTKSVALTMGAGAPVTIDMPALNGNDPSITSRATHQGSLADTDTYNVGSLVPAAGGASTITWTLSADCISWAALVFATGVDAP